VFNFNFNLLFFICNIYSTTLWFIWRFTYPKLSRK